MVSDASSRSEDPMQASHARRTTILFAPTRATVHLRPRDEKASLSVRARRLHGSLTHSSHSSRRKTSLASSETPKRQKTVRKDLKNRKLVDSVLLHEYERCLITYSAPSIIYLLCNCFFADGVEAQTTVFAIASLMERGT